MKTSLVYRYGGGPSDGLKLDRYAIVMVDVQLEYATKAALPSLHFPGEQG